MNALSRPVTQIDHDLLSICRRVGEIGMSAELALRAPDIDELTHACQGLAAVLRERRAAKEAGR